jgi:hypothetical protein
MSPAELAHVHVPIPHYLMGVLIGDGALTNGVLQFSVPPSKQAIHDKIGDLIGFDRLGKPRGHGTSIQVAVRGTRHKYNDMLRAVADMRLNVRSKERFIPEPYKLGSAANRLELLRGLMDTDGSAVDGRTTFHTCSLRLCNDVAELVRSLGGVAIIRKYDRAHESKPPEWQVNVRMYECPFSLPAKAQQWRSPARVHGKYITAIYWAGYTETRCISVSAADHLYITDGYNCTHNTRQAISATEATPSTRVNVICPAILCAEWADEWARCGDVPRSVSVLGAKKQPTPETADVVIASYDRASRPEVAGMLAARRNAIVIADEAHNLKTIGTRRATTILGEKGDGSSGLVHRASAIYFLTGTPAPNHVGELYPMLATGQRYSGDYYSFLGDFCVTRETPYGPRVVGYRNAAGLRALLDGWMLRRTNAVELPPTDWGEIVVAPEDCSSAHVPGTAGAQLKRAIELGDLSAIDSPHLATLRRVTGLAKAKPVARLAAELLTSEPSAKIVLFGIHRAVIDIIVAELRDFGVIALTGGTPDAARKRLKDQFQKAPEIRVAVCQMRAAGTGLTLTAANHLWIVEPSWVPADNDQAAKRIVRIGQHRSTSVKMVTLDTSIDRAVNSVLRKKRQLIDEILS